MKAYKQRVVYVYGVCIKMLYVWKLDVWFCGVNRQLGIVW